ncbi:hypothetical protein SAY87_029190 [Trapa incisa]|uniref:Uncharacterized protein n=1 Tax=Trapa incisa TaxID=236973 RepID=A0AAN7L3V0_9MYRT|nr:hypothetical protein SAY87_029190 [Trapa incisa]
MAISLMFVKVLGIKSLMAKLEMFTTLLPSRLPIISRLHNLLSFRVTQKEALVPLKAIYNKLNERRNYSLLGIRGHR